MLMDEIVIKRENNLALANLVMQTWIAFVNRAGTL